MFVRINRKYTPETNTPAIRDKEGYIKKDRLPVAYLPYMFHVKDIHRHRSDSNLDVFVLVAPNGKEFLISQADIEFIDVSKNMDNYLKNDGRFCPVCGSDPMIMDLKIPSNEKILKHRVCKNPNCKTRWVDIFQLVSFKILVPENDDE